MPAEMVPKQDGLRDSGESLAARRMDGEEQRPYPRRARARHLPRIVPERVIDEHQTGKRDNSSIIWSLMMLEMWFRECFD